MLNLTDSVKVIGNKVSGLNLDKKAHAAIERGIELLKGAGQEIPGVKLSKKEMFEYAAEILLAEIETTLRITKVVEEEMPV